MKTNLKTFGIAVALAVCAGAWLFAPLAARAHCDTMDGPVVMAAKAALEKADVTPVLKWVKKEHEGEIREAFRRTLAARSKGAEVKELADMYFFETLVRIHRAGEGAPYTGLQPAGTVEAPIAAADKALESGSVDDLAKEIGEAVSGGIKKRFAKAFEAKKHAEHNVEAGREFVEAYVEFVHYVERLHQDAVGHAARHHEAEAAKSGHQH